MLSLTLACAFLACARPYPTTPDDGPLLAPIAADIKLTYICGNSFRVRNTSPDTVTVRYDVYGTTETGPVFLAGKPAGAAYSETFFTTVRKGTVRIFLGTQLVQTKANGNTPQCTLPSPPRPPIPSGFSWPRADSVKTLVFPGDTTARYYRELVLLEVSDSMQGAAFAVLLQRFSAQVVGGFPNAKYYVLHIPDPGTSYDSLLAIVTALRATPGVVMAIGAEYGNVVSTPFGIYAEDGSRSPAGSLRNAGLASVNWSRVATRATLAWGCEIGSTTTPVAVGVLDYLFDPTSADLSPGGSVLEPGALEAAPPATGASARLGDSTVASHGQGVAGVLGAVGNNGVGVAGMIWNRNLRMYALARDTTALIWNFPLYLKEQIVPDLLSRHVRVLVASLSFGRADEMVYPDIERQIRLYLAAGGVLVMPTENSGRSYTLAQLQGLRDGTAGLRRAAATLRPQFPGQVWFVLGSDKNGGVPSTQTRFPGNEDIAAPAVAVLTLGRPGDFNGNPDSAVRSLDGGSFAAPAVAGAAALLWSRDPSLTGPQVLTLLQNGAGRARPNPFTGEFEVPPALPGGAKVVDIYSSLQLQAETARMPLCGNRLWPEGNTVYAERGTGTPEPIATLPNYIAGIFPYHGGRKVVIEDGNYDWFQVELGPTGQWSQPVAWDGVEPGIAGSGLSIYGQTHDGDSTAFVHGDSLYLGTRWLSFDTPVTNLQPSRIIASNGGEQCIQEVLLEAGWTCTDTSWFGTSTDGYWDSEATPTGDRLVVVRYVVRTSSASRIATPVDCYNGGPLNEYAVCRKYLGTGTQSTDRTEIWTVDRTTGAKVNVLQIPNRTVGLATGAEDGSGFALATSTDNGSGFGQNCTIQFYHIGGSNSAVADGLAHPVASTCSPWDFVGGFSATRRQLTSVKTPSSRGFALQARLGHVARR